MSNQTNEPTAPPVADEQFANARLDAIIAEHRLPAPERRNWLDHSTWDPTIASNHCTLVVQLADRADVLSWAAALGFAIKDDFTAWETTSRDDGTWTINRVVGGRVDEWLPKVHFRVKHVETRWAAR